MVIIALVGVIAGGWYLWSRGSDRVPDYSTTTVARGDVIQVVTATGESSRCSTSSVSSQVSGIISKLYVDWNSPVKTGQMLAQLDPATYQSTAPSRPGPARQYQGELASSIRAQHGAHPRIFTPRASSPSRTSTRPRPSSRRPTPRTKSSRPTWKRAGRPRPLHHLLAHRRHGHRPPVRHRQDRRRQPQRPHPLHHRQRPAKMQITPPWPRPTSATSRTART